VPINKNRLLLVVICAIAAGETPLPEPAETSSITNTVKPDNNVEEKPPVQPDQDLGNYLVKIPECLSINVDQSDTLKSISEQNRWFNKDPKNLIRQNLVYNNNGKELRISVIPSETNKTWLLQSFDVDNEGLPIPKNKTLGLRYDQLAEKINAESSGYSLASDEQKVLVDLPNTSGSVLFINDEPVEIKLFNKENQRLLECQKTNCVCNQALSS